jgi:CubicO group peptidase (beta-lactamase class C family)
VAIVADGRIVLAEGFGVRDHVRGGAVTADTQFAIASCTKAFTAAGIGLLADAGALSLDQPVRELMSDFVLMDTAASAGAAPRDLLCHRTGLPRHDMLWYVDSGMSRGDLIGRLRHLEPSAPFRARYQYNNLMLMSAGRLVEVVGGKSWEDFTRARLLQPLGMNRTVFSVAAMAKDANAASAHKRRDGKIERVPYRNVDVLGPAGAINSTARDMARWIAMQVNGGEVDGRRLLSRDVIEQMHRPAMPLGTPGSADYSDPMVGLGWRTDYYRGQRRVHHGGALDGFRASVQLYPDRKFGVCAFVNAAPSELADMICRTVSDAALGLEPRPWLGDAAKRLRTAQEDDGAAKARMAELRVAKTGPTHPLSDYAGEYLHPGYGALTVLSSESGLKARYGAIGADLQHWHFDTFNAVMDESRDDTLQNIRFTFETDSDGRIAAVSTPFETSVAPIRFVRAPATAWADAAFRQSVTGEYVLSGRRWRVTLIGEHLFLQAPGASPARLDHDIEERFFVLSTNRTTRVRFVEGGLDIIESDGIYRLTRTAP